MSNIAFYSKNRTSTSFVQLPLYPLFPMCRVYFLAFRQLWGSVATAPGGERPCGARVPPQGVLAVPQAQANPVISTKRRSHFVDDRRPPAIAGGLLLFLPHSPRLITATEAFVAGFAGMAPAHRLNLDAVKIAALSAFIIGAARYAAANRLAANLGLRHTLPPVLGSPSMRPRSMSMRGNGWNQTRPPAPAARPPGLRPPAHPK